MSGQTVTKTVPRRELRQGRWLVRLALTAAILVAAILVAEILGPGPSASAASPSDEPLAAARRIDSLLAGGQLAGNATLWRRIYLDILGQLPDPRRVKFDQDLSQDTARAQLAERLLADSRYGQHWARYWRDVIFYRRSEERAVLAAPAFERYLAEQLNQGVGWDTVCRDLVTATGDVREDGRTGLIMAQGGRPEEVVSELSRIFLGIQIQCAQCHDHPTDRWKRTQFHELAAFFPRVAVRPTQGMPRSFQVTVNDEPFDLPTRGNNRFRGTPEHYMPNLERPSERGTLVQPIFFVSGQRLAVGASDAQRRDQLAQWMTSEQNPWFARALVNRLWSELVGRGFYAAVDDLGPDRPCQHSEVLDYLSSQFTASGYDLKWLVQTIVGTEAYATAADSSSNSSSPAVACARRLSGDELFDALTATLGLELPAFSGGRRGGPRGPLNSPRLAFNSTFGFDPSQPADERNSTIPQALLLMNSPLVNRALDAPLGPARMARLIREDATLVQQLYLKALSRPPEEAELAICLDYLQEAADREEAAADLLWALINSTEFLHRR